MEDASNSSNFDRSDQHRYPEEKTASDGGTVIVPYHGVILPPPQSESSTASGPQASSTGLMGIRPAFKTDADAVERMDQSSATLAPLSSGQEWQPRSSPGSSEASLKRPAPGPLHLKQEEHGSSLKMGQTQQQSITDSAQTVFEAKRLKSEGPYHESAASSVINLPSISLVLREPVSWDVWSQASYTKLRLFQDDASDTLARRLVEPDTTSFRMSSSKRIGKLASRVVKLANDTLSGGGDVSGTFRFVELAQKINRVLEIVNESETLGDKSRQPPSRFTALTNALWNLDYQLRDTKMWVPVEIVGLPRVLEELRVIAGTNDVDRTRIAAWAEMCPEGKSVLDILDPLPGWSDLTLTVSTLPMATETGSRIISSIQQAVETFNRGLTVSTGIPTYWQTKTMAALTLELNGLSRVVETADRDPAQRSNFKLKKKAKPLATVRGYIDTMANQLTLTGRDQDSIKCFNEANTDLKLLADRVRAHDAKHSDAWSKFFGPK